MKIEINQIEQKIVIDAIDEQIKSLKRKANTHTNKQISEIYADEAIRNEIVRNKIASQELKEIK